jgi:hypothetical protein
MIIRKWIEDQIIDTEFMTILGLWDVILRVYLFWGMPYIDTP